MAEDRSLDDFAESGTDGDSSEVGSDAVADIDDAADSDDAAGSDDAADVADVDPAVATSTWHADGVECDRCGERVDRRWRDGDALVCVDCASW